MDELVKRLRNEAETERYLLPHSDNGTAALLEEAADAIEALSAAVEGYESSTNMALVEKDGETVIEFQPKWIPVTERLPEEYVDVLCYCSRNGEYGCGAWHKEDKTIYWTGLDGMIPTHWMPLPPAPKEES